MSFNPLGNFDPKAFLAPPVIAAAREFKAKLPNAPPGHGLSRLYAHWTVSACNCDFTDYNGEAKTIGGSHVLALEHSPLDQIAGFNANPQIAGTWRRNTGSIACAITGMDGATESDFGPDPVTVAGLTYLCALCAAFASKYGIDVAGKVPVPGTTHLADNNADVVHTAGEWNMLTHGEVALLDGYPSERWDLATFAPLPAGVVLTPAMRATCGDALRLMTRRIVLAL